jgi:hypothetical protein
MVDAFNAWLDTLQQTPKSPLTLPSPSPTSTPPAAAASSQRGDLDAESSATSRTVNNTHNHVGSRREIPIHSRGIPARRFHVLRLAEIFHGRGEAHVEFAWNPFASARLHSQWSERDCLHLCIAPGVSDALAMATLEALVRAHEAT